MAKRLPHHGFDQGLWVVGGQEQTPDGFLRRARGTNSLKTPSLRLRLGSSLLYSSMNAHSLFRYNDVRFQGVSTVLYRNAVSISTGHAGTRMAFLSMPPQVLLFDYLFVADGTKVIKVSSTGAVTQWGIDAPLTDFTVAVGAAGALTGVYQYYVAFKNTTTGSRSNPNTNAQSVTLAAQRAELTSIPVSTDTQVGAREIYRTLANGEDFFLLTTINDNTTTVYSDNTIDDDLDDQEIQFNNVPPDDAYADTWGPFNGYVFWTRIATSGYQGRVVYSVQSRPESVDSFLDITNTDDPVQKGCVWNGANWAFSEKYLFQILGTDPPFTRRQVFGVPGTTKPFSVAPTPFGIAYQALDGPRLFNGNDSVLIGVDRLGPLYRGEDAENLTAFVGVVGAYARNEYILSDASGQTLAFNLKDGRIRDLGVAMNAIYPETDTSVIQATISSTVVSYEDITSPVYTDNGTAITLEWEWGGALSDIAQTGIIQRYYLDINTNGQSLTPTMLIDGTTVALPPFQTTGRDTVEWSVNRNARVLNLRLEGSCTALVELFGAEIEVYTPEPLQS